MNWIKNVRASVDIPQIAKSLSLSLSLSLFLSRSVNVYKGMFYISFYFVK